MKSSALPLLDENEENVVEPNAPADLDVRIAEGLFRLVEAGRIAAWHDASEHGLSPTQAQIVAHLLRSPARLCQLAAELGVSAATASDAVRALVDKGIVDKDRDPHDARAVRLTLTQKGNKLAERAGRHPAILDAAVGALDATQKVQLLLTVIALIEELQKTGAIAAARVCTTCTHFVRDAHAGVAPHHCNYVDKPLQIAELRTACPEHAPMVGTAETARPSSTTTRGGTPPSDRVT